MSQERAKHYWGEEDLRQAIAMADKPKVIVRAVRELAEREHNARYDLAQQAAEIERQADLIEQQDAKIERLRSALTEARRWIGDGDQSEGLDRRFWTPEHAAAVDMMDAALAEGKS